SWAGPRACPWRRGRPGACGRGSPRRVGGGGARSRLAGHAGVVEGLGSRHTRRVAYLHYTRGRAAAAPAPVAGKGSAGAAPAKQIRLTKVAAGYGSEVRDERRAGLEKLADWRSALGKALPSLAKVGPRVMNWG